MKYSYHNLKSILTRCNAKQLIDIFRDAYLKKIKGAKIQVLSYKAYGEYSKSGNRLNFERSYFERRANLNILTVLSVYSDEYLPNLEEYVNAICEEYTWVLPAHSFANKANDYTRVDLFSAETGFSLSELYYIFKEKFTDDLKIRILQKLKENITDNYERYIQSYDSKSDPNNWQSVCAGSIGAVYLYAFPDRFALVQDRIFSTMETYLTSIKPDGSTEEGVSYWEYGFGFFTYFFDVYKEITGVRHAFTQLKKIKSTLKYINNARMQGNIYLPFADGGSRHFMLSPYYAGALKSLFGKDFIMPKYNFEDIACKIINYPHAQASKLILCLAAEPEQTQLEKELYFKNNQIYLNRKYNYVFTAKCGKNNDVHNHNDIGSFQIVAGGKRLICDIGAGEYNKDFFSEKRYDDEVFVCGAQSHSVPEIGGVRQQYGNFKGKVITAKNDVFEMEITGAYPKGLKSYKRSFSCEEGKVILKEEISAQKSVSVIYRLVGDCEFKLASNGIITENMLITFSSKLKANIQKKVYKNHSGEDDYAYIAEFESKAALQEHSEIFEFLIM